MKPSIALQAYREEVLERFRMRNPRIFGATSGSEDTDNSDLDILVDAPAGASLYDLARVETELEAILGCKVQVLTKGFMAPDVLDRAKTDLIPMP